MPQPTRPRRILRRFLLNLFVIGLVLFNLEVAIQARAMTHFQPINGAAPRTEELSVAMAAQTLATGIPIPRPSIGHSPAEHNLPFETRRIELHANEYLEAWYVPQPQPRGIVLLFAGYIEDKDPLLTPAAHFYQLGYSSLMVDFRGSGGSSGNDTTLGLREADDVAAAVAYAQAQWPEQPIVLYGISMGGAAILRAVAINEIRPAAIIIEGVFDSLLATARHRFDAVGLPGSPMSELLIFWGSVQIGYNGFAHNPIDYARAVTAPTLVLTGGKDRWVRPEESQALFEQLQGPKQLVFFPEAGHQMPFVYHDERRWVDAVQTFLK